MSESVVCDPNSQPSPQEPSRNAPLPRPRRSMQHGSEVHVCRSCSSTGFAAWAAAYVNKIFSPPATVDRSDKIINRFKLLVPVEWPSAALEPSQTRPRSSSIRDTELPPGGPPAKRLAKSMRVRNFGTSSTHSIRWLWPPEAGHAVWASGYSTRAQAMNTSLSVPGCIRTRPAASRPGPASRAGPRLPVLANASSHRRAVACVYIYSTPVCIKHTTTIFINLSILIFHLGQIPAQAKDPSTHPPFKHRLHLPCPA